MGAKDVLQSGWFRVSKIPADQRSVKTLAKVGGLVGKVIEIDEGSRYRYDYVRLKIACRDVSKVPKSAEGTLSMYIIDFGFEREMAEEGGEKVLKSGIKVGDDNLRPAKKSKADSGNDNLQQANRNGEDDNLGDKQVTDKSYGKQSQQVFWSAPPNMAPS